MREKEVLRLKLPHAKQRYLIESGLVQARPNLVVMLRRITDFDISYTI